MGKGFLSGDWHFGIHQLNEDKWLKITDDYFNNFFIPQVLKRWEKGDKIFINGDIFDSRSHLTLKVISFTLDLFNKFEELGFECVIIGGNHDYLFAFSPEHTSLRILERFPKVKLILYPEIYEFSDKKILMLPWDTHSNQLKEIKKYTGKVDYLFTHSDLRGAKTGIKNQLMVGNTIADYIGFPKVYASHIHIHQSINNFTFLGSPFHLDRNDKGNSKGITLVDFNTGEEEFIENNLSPEFKTIEIRKESDIDILERLLKIDNINNDKDNFIDIIINNSVIINSKKIKKKLEDVSKRKNVSSIKYHDDITIDDGIENISIDDIGISISTEDLLREYIKNQDIENELKNKFIDILEETIKLCKEEDQ